MFFSTAWLGYRDEFCGLFMWPVDRVEIQEAQPQSMQEKNYAILALRCESEDILSRKFRPGYVRPG